MTNKRSTEKGQGLVEYALILVLVAIVAIAILLILGPIVGNVFSNIIDQLGFTPFMPGGSGSDVVVITTAKYEPSGEFHLNATSNGDYDPSVTLTASPGGVMGPKAHHYCLKYPLPGCSLLSPCTITVTSSKGGSATVVFPPGVP